MLKAKEAVRMTLQAEPCTLGDANILDKVDRAANLGLWEIPLNELPGDAEVMMFEEFGYSLRRERIGIWNRIFLTWHPNHYRAHFAGLASNLGLVAVGAALAYLFMFISKGV